MAFKLDYNATYKPKSTKSNRLQNETTISQPQTTKRRKIPKNIGISFDLEPATKVFTNTELPVQNQLLEPINSINGSEGPSLHDTMENERTKLNKTNNLIAKHSRGHRRVASNSKQS